MKRLVLFLTLLMFAAVQILQAQAVEITGTVTSSEDGSPVPGASIIVKGTTIGTVSSSEGTFTLRVPEDAAELVVSFVGLKTQDVRIEGRTQIDIVMEPDILGLDEVVVTALGISREKKALGYSVQDIAGDEIATAREQNVVNSLQGKIAGVQITNATGGGISSSSRIVIRGNSSFGNNQPLFVVDGTPIINAATGVDQWNAKDFGNASMDIDPNNIESISVLKGASATALYGSRGANGVVLITTKKATRGRRGIGISFNSTTTFENINILPNYQNDYGQGYNGSEYVASQNGVNPDNLSEYQDWAENNAFAYYDGNWGGVMDGIDESWGPRLDIGLMLPQFDGQWDEANDQFIPSPWISHPDNTKSFFETGTTLTNTLALEGATDVAAARLTLSNTIQKGVVPNTDQTRNNIGLSSSMNLSRRLKASSNINYVNLSNDNIPNGGYTSSNIMQSIGGWFGRQVDMEVLKEKWQEDNPHGDPFNWNRSYHNNPYWTVNKNVVSRDRNRVFGNVNLEYQITDWLNILGRAGTDYYHEVRKAVRYDRSLDTPAGGDFWQQTRTYQETNLDLILTADKNLTPDIHLGGSLGANYRRNTYQYQEIQANELTVPDLFTIGNVAGTPASSMYDEEKETNSVFGSVNFSFRDWLFIDVTARNDWSSSLPSDSWSYFYPSVNLGWVFTDAFNIGGNIFSFGKLRTSWAQVGNDTDPYQTLATYGSADPFNGVTQFQYATEIPPLNLKPETTTTYEFGGDLRFFMNRLGIDVTYYDKVTTDQIMAVEIPRSSGFNSMRINAGEIENKGVELQLIGKILQLSSGFNWEMMVNWSKNTNTVNKLYGDLEAYELSASWGGVSIQANPGEPWGVIHGGGYVYNDNGERITLSNGLPQHSAVPVPLGEVMPDWFGGVNNMFSWKGINASFLIDFRKGGDIFSVTHWFGAYSGISNITVEGDRFSSPGGDGPIRETGVLFDGVFEDGTPNDVVVAEQDYFGNYWGLAEPSIIDGGFVKLREVIVGYDIPVQNVPFVQALNVSFVGRNLAMLWKHESNDINIDPETGFGVGNGGVGLEQYQLPSIRSLGFKIGVKF
jgi:TonB-linked SusC/RagA family outer membrane protein